MKNKFLMNKLFFNYFKLPICQRQKNSVWCCRFIRSWCFIRLCVMVSSEPLGVDVWLFLSVVWTQLSHPRVSCRVHTLSVNPHLAAASCARGDTHLGVIRRKWVVELFYMATAVPFCCFTSYVASRRAKKEPSFTPTLHLQVIFILSRTSQWM